MLSHRSTGLLESDMFHKKRGLREDLCTSVTYIMMGV